MSELPQAGPHSFSPLRWWDGWSKTGRCSTCLYPKWTHCDKMRDEWWSPARAIGDKSSAQIKPEGGE